MSADQIEAAAALVAAARHPESLEMLTAWREVRASAQAVVGVPPLSGPLSSNQDRVAVDTGRPPMVASTVGDGGNLLLKHWQAIGYSGGRVALVRAGDRRTSIEVQPGVVVGPFGEVLDVRREEGVVTVFLASGDEVSGPIEAEETVAEQEEGS